MDVYYPGALDETLAWMCEAVNPSVQVHRERPPTFSVLIDGRPSEEIFRTGFKHLIVPFAGVPEPTIALLKQHPEVTGYNLHHNAADTADHALALLFAAAKIVVPNHNALSQGDWSPRYQPSRAFSFPGKTALILGFGNIGRRVSAVLQALGVKVLATRSTSTRIHEDGGAEVHPSKDLHALLPLANILMVCLPLTPETKGLIGAREIDLLPAGAIIVNIGRGAIIDETGLFQALKERRLHSAGIDVWWNYPKNKDPISFAPPEQMTGVPPSNLPFNELDNIVMSPHVAGSSSETERHRALHLAQLVNAIAKGEEVPNKVRLDAGY